LELFLFLHQLLGKNQNACGSNPLRSVDLCSALNMTFFF
jgi:hypothetical protein